MLRTDLDSVGLVVDIKNTLLDFVVDLSCRVDKSFLDVGGGFRRGLHENETVFSRESLALFTLDVPASLQIAFVPYQHDDHVGIGMLPSIFQPGG